MIGEATLSKSILGVAQKESDLRPANQPAVVTQNENWERQRPAEDSTDECVE